MWQMKRHLEIQFGMFFPLLDFKTPSYGSRNSDIMQTAYIQELFKKIFKNPVAHKM